ncbi:hypothetical protein [Pantoea septica]|uniref:hypothetical protein n=1 Tax=Pantoea septica TaxID=472695 RepID=UPI00289DC9B9|nr:hypothetical protein [Pantoea septica]
MGNEKNIQAKGEQPPVQNVMQKDVQELIMWWIRAASVIMLEGILFIDKFKYENKNAWIGIFGVGCVCFMYFITLYNIYGSFPNKQKTLKAYIDAIANMLALAALIFSYVYIKFYGKAENLFEFISTIFGDVVIGVICGVLLARVAFPLWDLYSSYRKI